MQQEQLGEERYNESASPDAEFTGEFSQSDFVVPRWTIDKDTGQFTNSVTQETLDELLAVVLRIGRSRLFWGRFKGGETELKCYSSDGVEPDDQNTPFGNIIDGPTGKMKTCDGCAMAEWKNGEPPQCSEIYNYLVMQPDNDIPSVLSLQRMRFKVAKQLNTLIRFAGIRTFVRFTTEREESKNGSFWQLRFIQHDKNKKWINTARQVLKTRLIPLTSPPTVEDAQSEQPTIDHETGEVI